MFLITIAIRHEEYALDNIQYFEKLASAIITNMKTDRTRFYRKIEAFVRPMNQLEAGLHLNISNCKFDEKSLDEVFNVGVGSDKYKVSRIRFIARNFIKMDFICNNCLPFRINTDDQQNDNILNALRTVMTHPRTIFFDNFPTHILFSCYNWLECEGHEVTL